ncbi:uracil-DNA glycosylase [Sphingomonas sp. GV3]|uniref:uracil-DNA glycosylase n=1 Tax=Sphingomonas sp. GV3 TaxID=3040671 RepID=UPI00280A875F|nr:uracil-DNA glycosylase [Sphingomonas sp. GV3]
MGADQHLDWMGAAASALSWWQDAGVDMLVDDAPRDWLAPPSPEPADPLGTSLGGAATQAPAVAVPAVAMPETLEAFMAWRMGQDVPEASWRGISVAASGPADAAIMVLADCPDKDDGDAGTLLTGAAGRLFDRMLAAIGLSRDAIHVAAVCARRPVAGRMPGEVEERLGDIARHHIGLVAPKRLLLLGNAASRAILSAEMPGTRGSLHPFNHKRGTTQVVATFHPRFLIEKPVAKAEAWKDLQLLMGDWPA